MPLRARLFRLIYFFFGANTRKPLSTGPFFSMKSFAFTEAKEFYDLGAIDRYLFAFGVHDGA